MPTPPTNPPISKTRETVASIAGGFIYHTCVVGGTLAPIPGGRLVGGAVGNVVAKRVEAKTRGEEVDNSPKGILKDAVKGGVKATNPLKPLPGGGAAAAANLARGGGKKVLKEAVVEQGRDFWKGKGKEMAMKKGKGLAKAKAKGLARGKGKKGKR